MAVRVFVSYAREDLRHLIAFRRAMASLVRDELVELWDDRKIQPGERWESAIDERIKSADVIVLLLTASFVASDYCYDNEMRIAAWRESEGAIAVGVLVTPFDWPKTAPFNRWQVLPTGRKPISEWQPRDAGWTDVATRLRELITGPGGPQPWRRAIDLAGAPDIPRMIGRDAEIAQLTEWVNDPDCRLIVLHGMKGIGKSVLAARLASSDACTADQRIWQTVQDSPPLSQFLEELAPILRVPSDAVVHGDPHALLVDTVRRRRCLLVLDNLESLLQPGGSGRFRAEFEDYGPLLLTLAATPHRSCLIVTTRSMVRELEALAGERRGVRTLAIAPLTGAAAREIFSDADASFASAALSSAEWDQVADRGLGNPLAFNALARHVLSAFNGDTRTFLSQAPMHSTIEDIVDDALDRLSEEELALVHWIAVAREPTPLPFLRDQLLDGDAHRIWERFASLRGRSLPVESSGRLVWLHPVWLERVTARFVAAAIAEVGESDTRIPRLLQTVPLLLTASADHVREAQQRCRITPVVTALLRKHGPAASRARVARLLEMCMHSHPMGDSYLPVNALHLLAELGSLEGVRCTGVTVRHGFFRDTPLKHVDFSGSRFVETVFGETFANARAVRASPDGRYIASASVDGAVRLWRMPGMTLERVFTDFAGTLLSVVFGPDGSWLAVGSDTGVVTIRRLDVTPAEPPRHLVGEWGWAMSIDIDSGGRTIAVGYRDGVAVLWDAQSGTPTHVLPHGNRVPGLAFDPRGATLATACEDGVARVWDKTSGRLLHDYRGHVGRVFAIAFRADGSLVTGGQDGTVQVWRPGDRERGTVLGQHGGRVRCVAVAEDGRVASGGEDRTLRFWSPEETGRATVTAHGNRIRSVTFVPHTHVACSAADDSTIRSWDSLTGLPVGAAIGHTGGQKGIARVAGRPWIAAAGNDGILRLWHVEDGRTVAMVAAHAGTIWCVAADRLGRIATGGDDQNVRLWKIVHGRNGEPAITSLGAPLPHDHRVFSVAFSPDGRFLASGSEDQRVRVWNVEDDILHLGTLALHDNGVTSIAFDASGRCLVSGSDDRSVAVWDCAAWTPHRLPWRHAERVTAVTTGHRHDWAATADDKGHVAIWRLADPISARMLRVPPCPRHLAFAHDDRQLAIADAQGRVSIIAVAENRSGREIASLAVSRRAVNAICYLDDGTRLAAAGEDDAVTIWDVSAGTCLHRMKAERLYEGMQISGTMGLTEAQRDGLLALGATEDRE